MLNQFHHIAKAVVYHDHKQMLNVYKKNEP